MKHDSPCESSLPATETRSELLLEFQRVVAKLVCEGVISQGESNRFVRRLNRQARGGDGRRVELREFLRALLEGIDGGVIADSLHVRLSGAGFIGIRAELVAETLHEHGLFEISGRALNRLLGYGHQVFPQIVVEKSERICFGNRLARFRCFVLNRETVEVFIGAKPPVPVG